MILLEGGVLDPYMRSIVVDGRNGIIDSSNVWWPNLLDGKLESHFPRKFEIWFSILHRYWSQTFFGKVFSN